MVLVVAFHLFPAALTGGYIGVDVFFVVSGYLITSHLLRQVEKDGRIRPVEFWARRVRRLLPAALLVLAVSAIAVITVLPGTARAQNDAEIIGAATYVLNWLLAANSVDYLAEDNTPSIAQHYWSLSVEEQFYVIWPLLIIVAVWLGRRWFRARPRTALLTLLVIVCAASYAYSVVHTASSASSAYFITTTRAWEFALGGLVALLPAAAGRMPAPVRAGASWVALAVVIACAVLFTGTTPFPGWIALLPVGATAYLLWSGPDENPWAPQRLASPRPIQFVGDVSYSAYLWHWPLIIVATAILGTRPGWPLAILIGALTLLLAWLTKKYVEDPIRHAPGMLKRRLPTFAGAAVAMLVVLGIAVPASAVQQSRDAALSTRTNDLARDPSSCFGAFALTHDSCTNPFALTDTVAPSVTLNDSYGLKSSDEVACNWKKTGQRSEMHCELGVEPTDVTARFALVGDSHADQYSLPLALAAIENSWSVSVYSRGSCSPFSPPYDGADEKKSACDSWLDDTFDDILSDPTTSAVILAGRFEEHEEAPEHAADLMRRIQDAGKQVIFMRDLPGTQHEWGHIDQMEKAPMCVEREDVDDACSWTPKAVDRWATVAARDAGATIIDPWELVCPDGTCHMIIGGTIVYADGHHLARAFARTAYPWLADQIRNALSAR